MELVPYEIHEHVALIRDYVGYVQDEAYLFDADDESYLRSLDPKDWKTQDHYAVLGLKNSRYNATAEDIRRAYRQKLLAHHPDKRRSKGEDVKDESHDYFSCITIAYEILGNPDKRHAYDSVDPVAVDDSMPSAADIKKDFFKPLNEFFFRKARWSRRQPVPRLGTMVTDLNDVYKFYDFWEEYDTIRDYSYLDEEDKEKGEDRETRRAIERQNRAERARRRAEELRAVRQIVELAKSLDPRILSAVKAAKEAKAAKRQARLDGIKRRREAEAEQAKLEAEQLAVARAASEERHRAEAEQQRREREQSRMEAKKERRRLRTVVVDRLDHFISAVPDSVDTGAERVRVLADMDILCQRLSNVRLQELNTSLEEADSVEKARSLFEAEVQSVKRELQAPVVQTLTKPTRSDSSAAPSNSRKWTLDMIQLLVKAVNLLPAGTPKRWEAIAAFINQHAPEASVTGKEALKEAKALNKEDSAVRKEANVKAFDSFAHSVRTTEATKNVTITSQIEAEAPRPWTATEQRALEQALRSCPANQPSDSGGDRWQRIADIVGTRTRRECMLRCKELSEQVRAKKAALTAVNAAAPATSMTSAPKSSTKSSRKP
ncbi:unnamed protein product [Calicophoron daubneyi]|uniref:DnaJ homolog subfamily C member 2 n=1 Tax=Calicophoron daubneyi TaxID=300641 RepID=A0AAV2T6W7_CALDB